jgi:MFS family permease
MKIISDPFALSPARILCCGALIVTLSMGIRHGFGLWLAPMTQAYDWSRETFSFAIALQNLFWGLTGIFAGMLADRFGAMRVLMLGGLLYAFGLVGMSYSTTPVSLSLSAGLLIGAAQAGTTYAVVYGLIGRHIEPNRRSMAMGIAAAAGSFGQFLMVPIENALIDSIGWQSALSVLAWVVLLILPLALFLREPALSGKRDFAARQPISQAIREAFTYPSFVMLLAGYFVCGFQVVFIGVHMPSYLGDKGLPTQVASYALGLIGLFNVLGTYLAGYLGSFLPKRWILATIYFGRSMAIILFLWLPLTPVSVYVFSAVMGFLWLSTVPPTNAIIAQIFGVSHLSMLSGVVFFSHQIGSFLGVWLGGKMYDFTGSYDLVWAIAIALGLFAALINLPIREFPIRKLA